MSQSRPLAYEGEFGFTVRIDTDFNATGATLREFVFKAPDGTKTSKTATAVTTDADGDFEWTSTEDFFVEGRWSVQLVLTFGATKVLKSERKFFTVGPDTSAT